MYVSLKEGNEFCIVSTQHSTVAFFGKNVHDRKMSGINFFQFRRKAYMYAGHQRPKSWTNNILLLVHGPILYTPITIPQTKINPLSTVTMICLEYSRPEHACDDEYLENFTQLTHCP